MSQYALPPGGAGSGSGEQRDGEAGAPVKDGWTAPQHREKFASKQDLPYILRLGLRFSPVRWKATYMLASTLSAGLGSGLAFAAITGSLSIGITLGVLFALTAVVYMVCPDFSQGIFLDMLLQDAKRTREIANATRNSLCAQYAFMILIFLPLVSVFLVLPLAHEESWFGEYHFIIVISMWVVAMLGSVPQGIMEIMPNSANEIGRVWESKIKDYMHHMHTILLRHDTVDEETGQAHDVTRELAEEFEKAEHWAQQVIDGTGVYYSCMVACPLVLALINVGVMAAWSGGQRQVAAIVTLSLFTAMMVLVFIGVMHGMAKPNLMWERMKVRLLNNPRIQRVVARIGWADRWEAWLNLHELNASRAFGAKVTTNLMRKVGGSIASLFAIVVYLLLREQVRGML
eukprot:g3339.t1